jgi:predicted HicB family RNase H-like nuclease
MTTREYKGYVGSVEVSIEDGVLHGRVLGIDDIVTYESETVPGLQREFETSLDDYLAFCAAHGKTPQRPLSGKLPFRTTPENHRAIAQAAQQHGLSINAWMERVLADAARQRGTAE